LPSKKKTLKIIPLGGVGEIGKNITAIEYGDEIYIVDCGISFPEDYMLGIDAVIPDFTYLQEKRENIHAMFITHGHDDHVGALAYFIKNFPEVQIYATKLTMGLINNKLDRHGIKEANLVCYKAGDVVDIGSISVETVRVNHSIADCVALVFRTPVGTVVFTGDFKVDYTPVGDEVIDLGTFARVGNEGVLALLMDSTNAEREGFTMSERTVGKTLDNIFARTKGRLIFTTFSSNIYRIQQIINASIKTKRKVCVMGTSMIRVVGVAKELGYLNLPDDVMIDVERISSCKNSELTIITTGSQGEPMSALSRIANGEYRSFSIIPGDTVVLSSSSVPGNEKTISNVINKLFACGADVIYSDLEEVHVSGHACREELKLMHTLIKPKYFVPVHGEQKHLVHHCRLAQELGMDKKNVILPHIGGVIEFTGKGVRCIEDVPAGATLVDGLGVGDVGNVVLRERQLLSEEGLLVVVASVSEETGEIISGPEIICRGFVYVKESEEFIEELRKIVMDVFEECKDKKMADRTKIKAPIKDRLRSYIYSNMQREPMIIPIILNEHVSVQDVVQKLNDE